MLRAAWLGLPPLLIAAMLAQSARPFTDDAATSVRITSWVQPIQFVEPPHTPNQEPGDATPRAAPVLEISTSATSTPFFSMEDGRPAIRASYARRAATFRVIDGFNSTGCSRWTDGGKDTN